MFRFGLIAAAAIAGPAFAENESIVASPDSVLTPYDIALRGCIEGIRDPELEPLGFAAQYADCNAWIAQEENAAFALVTRAELLLQQGWSETHFSQAMQDLTDLIDAGSGSTWAYRERSRLQIILLGDPDAALADINDAIAMWDTHRNLSNRARARDLLQRAYYRLEIAYRDVDAARARSALRDISAAEELDPENTQIAPLREWAAGFLRQMHVENGGEVVPG